MDLTVSKEANTTVVTLKGRLDALTAPEFDKQAKELTANYQSDMLITFAELQYISSAGLRSILALAKQLKQNGKRLVLAEVSGAIKDVFEVSGFYSIFEICKTQSDALAKLK